MRQMIKGLVAAAAVVTASAAPAMACGGGLFSSCSPCGGYVSPCGGGGYGGGYGYGGSYGFGGGYGGGYGYGGYGGSYAYQSLPSPQYYYVNQGPVYSGPGNFAPFPTYQEAAVSGWGAYNRPYYYGYDGGRYADAMTHYYDGAPRVYRPWRPRTSFYGYPRQRYYGGYSVRPRANWGYGPRPSYGPRYGMAPRQWGGPGPRWHQRPVLRRYY